ncbi:cytochrome P460 family protein [Posidoniimonas polymericola]|uniref:cytochrome P460 family protein n=1 Tax=Posidoniimonas polymericola TaxID=2528002 RepID=UPI0018D29047|nr:cytochrome P460 family protein [Posidoniimonas polymericola]
MILWLLLAAALQATAGCVERPAANAEKTAAPAAAGLPTPSEISVAAFEAELFAFVKDRRYVELDWKRDKRVRDTGPYIRGVYYGTHPAVRVFYSPEVIAWLEGGREGAIPDGAVIIKEQYPPPAARHAGKSEEELRDSLESWTIMVKDSKGSHDGWFWSNPGAEQEVVDNHQDFSHPISGFGLYCVRCHASTQSPGVAAASPENEFTFSSLRNIAGYDGEPIVFRVDESWRRPTESAPSSEGESGKQMAESTSGSHPSCTRSGGMTPCVPGVNPDFVAFYDGYQSIDRAEVQDLPPTTHDWVAKQEAGEPQQFVTSKQCMSCHAGLMEPYGPTMFVPTGDDHAYGATGRNISPQGEWQWTPMGLAGRDPVFLAQLESEKAMLASEFGKDPDQASRLSCLLEDTCLKCHGAMGRHEFHACGDRQGDTFGLELCEATHDPNSPIGEGDARLGALARDGISCMVCHRMQERPQPEDDDRPYLQYFLETSVTGNLYLGPPDELYGPFKDNEITAYPMQHALGITPKHSGFLQTSRMCGVCHTVTLPAVDAPLGGHAADELNASQVVKEFASFHHHVEQATYLEWLNSGYENEFNTANPDAQTCQDCHMSRGLHDEEQGIAMDSLPTRMAIIQDVTYPDAENLASHKDIDVRVREEGYARHNFSGLNLFLLELFEQFDDVLGVRTQDYMTGSKLEIENARRNFLNTARNKTAELEVASRRDGDDLVATVTVRNKAGHRFPSGVGFRRAFVELTVVELPAEQGGEERVVWGSGRTNSVGVLVDGRGRPLPTELFDEDLLDKQRHQPHHTEITQEDQAQIYESLLCNAEGRFTTSFLRGCETIKDNRLLPKGWTPLGPSPDLTGRYLEATHPKGDAAQDPLYRDGSGADKVTYRVRLPEGVDAERVEVRAALYYQAMPPYFLKNLFDRSPDGPATQRLHFLLSNAKLAGTPIENWKLLIANAVSKPAGE